MGGGRMPVANPRRTNARPNGGVVSLPAEGYRGRMPDWPLPTVRKRGQDADRADELVEAELALWAELWRTPQAAAWATMGTGLVREVATYCRWQVKGESGDLDATKEARYRADKLGLTPKSMRTLLWQIVGDELAAQREQPPATTSGSKRARTLGIAAVDPLVDDDPDDEHQQDPDD